MHFGFTLLVIFYIAVVDTWEIPLLRLTMNVIEITQEQEDFLKILEILLK